MPSSARAKVFESWNRKAHFYLGLYFIFFLWLFALTGLLLNHGQWAMAIAANDRRETRYERSIEPSTGGTDDGRAREAMRHLNLTGEINWPAAQQPGYLAFQVSRPTEASQVRIDLTRNRASVQHFRSGSLGAFRTFHTFSGSRFNDTARRDWMVTTAWVIAMDALAAGLVVMVMGSYYMWYRLKPKRRLGLLALAAGMLSCALFLAGLSYT